MNRTIGAASEPHRIVRMVGITKRFGRVTVLDHVDFELDSGEVHILAGENGAGKSTLIKILAGVHTDYSGTLEVSGRPFHPANPKEAQRSGVAVIHQELSLIPTMTVADNLFLGQLPTRGGFVRSDRLARQARELLSQVGLDVAPDRIVGQLPVAAQQLIEIAKALGHRAKVIVMDEPTSALNAEDVDRLFCLIGQLKQQGCGVIYITHKMEEIERLADRITVLRDGRNIGTATGSDLPPDRLIQWMIGRKVTESSARRTKQTDDVRLRLRHYSVAVGSRSIVADVSLEVRRGEVVGLAGLQGSGNSQMLMSLFGGYGRRTSGQVEIDGHAYRPSQPRQALRRHLALLTNDRKANGLVLPLSIIANTTLASLEHFSPRGWRNAGRERQATRQIGETLSLRAGSLDMEVATLSGGNQQKVALAKWLLTEPGILLLDEPTRGIDVGSKQEIYELINQWTDQGIAILLVSSEMPELLSMSDRVVAMHRGRVTRTFEKRELSADRVLQAAMGVQQEAMLP